MILYFTGTGNSKYVACMLAEELGEEPPIDITTAPLNIDVDHQQLIWVFPIYSWGVPPVVIHYMNKVAINGVWRHWMVCTCGDDVGYAHRQWRKAIESRGWDAGGTFSVIMPNTYTLMRGFDVDADEVVRQKLQLAPERVHDIALCMQQGREPDDVAVGKFPSIKSKIIYPWFIRHAMSPKPFHALESCLHCGKCANLCPLHNITMIDRSPKWGDNCAMCLRCYHICPAHAVAYGKATRGKGQYVCKIASAGDR
jgi:ferredoxin/flavodoxin